MYGYVEVPGENTHDTVEVPTVVLFETFESLTTDSRELLKQKLQTLIDIDVIDDNSSIVLDSSGIVNQDETLHMFQVFKKHIARFAHA